MMMCKKSSDAHLFSHDIVDFRGRPCILLSSICTTLFGNYVIVSPILQKMDLVEMFDMLGERSCGGGWAM